VVSRIETVVGRSSRKKCDSVGSDPGSGLEKAGSGAGIILAQNQPSTPQKKKGESATTQNKIRRRG